MDGIQEKENLSPLGPNSLSPLPTSRLEFYFLSPLKASFLSHGGLGILAHGLPWAKDTHFILFRNKAKRVATLPKDQAGRPSTYCLSLMAKCQLKSDGAHRALAGWIRASEQPESFQEKR